LPVVYVFSNTIERSLRAARRNVFRNSRWAARRVGAAMAFKYSRSPAHTPSAVARFCERSFTATAVISMGEANGIRTVPTTTRAGACSGKNSR
jgi:hypothetical protein